MCDKKNLDYRNLKKMRTLLTLERNTAYAREQSKNVQIQIDKNILRYKISLDPTTSKNYQRMKLFMIDTKCLNRDVIEFFFSAPYFAKGQKKS